MFSEIFECKNTGCLISSEILDSCTKNLPITDDLWYDSYYIDPLLLHVLKQEEYYG